MLRDRVQASGLSNIDPVHGGLGQGLLDVNQFDRAFLVTVLGEIPDQLGALQEIRRGLKPGGILSVTQVLPDPHYQSQQKVRLLCERAGFAFEEVFASWRAFTMNLVKGRP